MTAESLHDRITITSLLFTKAIPNYKIPIPTDGYRLYSCTDCGDRYIMESSYEYHVNRKCMQITYNCQHCGEAKLFYNRCNLLSHIRSHAFKTASINVSDLKVEPLPLDFFTAAEQQDHVQIIKPPKKPIYPNSTCFECKMDINKTGIAYKDRATHYMQYSNAVLYSCPICMFTLPTTCALKSHLRLHLKHPPFYCPECGIHLRNNSIHYPYGHDCEGFNMMRATARFNCSLEDCHIFHPNAYNQHMKTFHLKKIYKCPVCYIACVIEENIQKHLKTHRNDIKPSVFYQCQQCYGKLILENQIDNHLRTHVTRFAYPCWNCGKIFKETAILINHHMEKHPQEIKLTKQLYAGMLNDDSTLYNVVKRCDQCKRTFTFKSTCNEIYSLPNVCPNKCSKINNRIKEVIESHIVCHLCNNKIPQNWDEIKKHYAKFHKSMKCVDVKIAVTKLDKKEYSLQKKNNILGNKIKKRTRNSENKDKIDAHIINTMCLQTPQSINSEFTCTRCGKQNEDKNSLEMHMRDHRDPYMAYQCMECGQSIITKSSFSLHLLIEHGITDVMDYINKKQCFDETALFKKSQSEDNDPLKDNQCQICREQFDNSHNLQKHFRVHGMAFLLKYTNKGSSL